MSRADLMTEDNCDFVVVGAFDMVGAFVGAFNKTLLRSRLVFVGDVFFGLGIFISR